MGTYQSYKDLEVWQEARKLVKEVYKVTANFPSNEYYGLVNQLRRCSVSIPANIAEGIGRRSKKETVHFLYISRGSLYELETEIYLSYDLKFINNDILNTVLKQIEMCRKLISGLINYFNRSENLK